MRSLPEESGIRDDKAGCVTNSLQRAGGTPALLANRGRLSGLLRLISLIGTDRVGSARRAHPVRGKGRAHLTQNPEGYEPSFSLIRADSRRSYERKVVMDAKELPARPSLEQYKKQAKDLLKSCKAGDPEAVLRIKQHNPRLSDLQSSAISRAKIALADAQFAIAREHGFESWPKFTKQIEKLNTENFVAGITDPVAAFIEAASVPLDGSSHASGTLDRAEAILAAYPEVGSSNVYTTAILGDAAAVRRFIARDAKSATTKGGPLGWDALTYLCFSRYLRLDKERSDGFVRAATALLDAEASANTGWMEKNHQPEPEWESAIYGAAGVAHHAELTRLLLERGADPNDGETPYHVPETRDNAALKVLVESGKLNDDSLTTILLRKTDWHDYEGIQWLLQHGANPNQSTRWGRMALHHAVQRDNSIKIIEVLLDHGADPTLLTSVPK